MITYEELQGRLFQAEHKVLELQLRLAALRQEPVAWLYDGDDDFNGKVWVTQTHVTTSEQVARWKGRNVRALYLGQNEVQA